MRMMRFKQDERGAVLAVVALTLIALFGMAVLVIDVGGLLVMKRRMVTTSDAAALAAAQQCAMSKGEVTARAEANEVAVDNYASAGGKVLFSPNCAGSTGEATARYHADQTLFFAPILGLGENMGVSAPATAIWGPANSGLSVPLMVGAAQFAGNLSGECDFPPTDPPSGQECAFWYDSDEIGNAAWGWVNLNNEEGQGKGWDVGSDITCPNVGAAQRADWIANNYPDPLPLNWPDPTYVCADTGFTDANWEDLRDIIPSDRVFPVNDPDGSFSAASGSTADHGQVDKDGQACTQEMMSSTPPQCVLDKYDMIGFTILRIIALYDGTDPAAIGTAGIAAIPAAGGTCKGRKRPDSGEVFAVYEMGPAPDCPNSIVPDVVEPADPFVYTESGGGPNKVKNEKAPCTTLTPSPAPSGCAYLYDPETFEITWAGDPENVFIEFTWSRAEEPGSLGTEGACSDYGLPPPPDDMAKLQDKCLVTQWIGFQASGQDPGTGPDLGLRAIRLAE